MEVHQSRSRQRDWPLQLRARFYDPILGRFISADTAVPSANDPQALNRYAYASNNPLRYTDPTGHFFLDPIVDALQWAGDLAFQQVKSSVRLAIQATPIYGAVTGDWEGMLRADAQIGVQVAVSYASMGVAKIPVNTLGGILGYTAAKGGIGFGSAFAKAAINGASLDQALGAGIKGAEYSAGYALLSGTWSAATNTDPLSASRMNNTIGTKLTEKLKPGESPSGFAAGSPFSNFLYSYIPFIQSVSAIHDWLGRSYGAPGLLNTGANEAGLQGCGLGYEISKFTPANIALMIPATVWTYGAILDRGLITYSIGTMAVPPTGQWNPSGVNSNYSTGF